MKRTSIALALAVSLVALSAPARAATRGGGSHPFGLGLMLGAPTGLTGKLYLGGRPFALQMGIGVVDDFDDENGLHLHLDVVWHPVVLAREAAFTLPLYLGVGARLLDHDYHYRYNGVYYDDGDTRLGVRVPFGLLMDFNRVPLDLFLEVAVVVDFLFIDDGPYGPLHHHDRVDLNGGLGLRYYF